MECVYSEHIAHICPTLCSNDKLETTLIICIVELLLEVCMVCVNRQEKGPTHCGPRVRPSGPVSNNPVLSSPLPQISFASSPLTFHGHPPSQNHLCGHLLALTFLLNHPLSSHGHHHPETIHVVIAQLKLVIISFNIIYQKLNFAVFSGTNGAEGEGIPEIDEGTT